MIALLDSGADTAPLAALHAACFDKAWDADAIRSMCASPGTFVFWEQNGFVMARVAAGEAEILTLAVEPKARGRGLGRKLLDAAITKAMELGAQAMFLEVGSDNPHALALYAGLGFTKVGMRKAYYDGRDAQLLRLSLPGKFA